MTATPTPLLRIAGLKTRLETDAGPILAADDVAFDVLPGEAVGLVGESGCGKTITALSIMRLVTDPGRIVAGRVELMGEDLLGLSEDAMRSIRGGRIAMIFQEPMTSLNPVLTVGAQISEAILAHRACDRRETRARALALLRQVDLSSPETQADLYPHQLSGGMRQRVMIAMALASDPALLIADEPTTALDVTTQAQVLSLLGRLRAERQLSILLVTHDLGVVAEACDHVVVMYAGKVVERAPVTDLFRTPRHPYTTGLLRSIPSRGSRRRRLEAIPGRVPTLSALPRGCRFRDRCSSADEQCEGAEPQLVAGGDGQRAVACFHPS
jgi:peptide/nickel transport system ATP-binding protein